MSAYSSTLKPGGMVFSAKKTGTDAKVALLDRGVTVATAGLLYAQFCILESQFLVTSVSLFHGVNIACQYSQFGQILDYLCYLLI